MVNSFHTDLSNSYPVKKLVLTRHEKTGMSYCLL